MASFAINFSDNAILIRMILQIWIPTDKFAYIKAANQPPLSLKSLCKKAFANGRKKIYI